MKKIIFAIVLPENDDVQTLKRAKADGVAAPDLLRQDSRVVASLYYSGRRQPSTLLFEATNPKLGDEPALFRDLEK